ncbi:MAG: putative ABC transporter permease [Ruminococcus sp.]|nr:putative ABC transporter permease [Candidatus Apopatosoma intestinale]
MRRFFESLAARSSLSGKSFLDAVESLFFLFFTGAVIGFVYEVLYTRLIHGYWAYRGTFWGPYLPLYGVGALLLYALFHRLVRIPPLVFLLSGLTTGLLEYGSGRVLLLMTGKKYWNYSRYSVVFDRYGFVSLRSVLIFAVGAMLLLYAIVPLLLPALEKAKPKTRHILFGILAAIFLCDAVLTLLIPNTLGQVAG